MGQFQPIIFDINYFQLLMGLRSLQEFVFLGFVLKDCVKLRKEDSLKIGLKLCSLMYKSIVA